MTGRSTPTLLSIFFEGPTLLSPFLSSRTLLSNKHFFEHFFELITQKSTFLSAHLSTVTFLRTFLRTQKSGFTLLSTFLSGFTHLRAFLSAQKSPQGHSGPLCQMVLVQTFHIFKCNSNKNGQKCKNGDNMLEFEQIGQICPVLEVGPE